MTEQLATARKPPSRTRRIVQVALSLVLVEAIFYYLLRGIDLATVWAEIQALTWLELATLVAIAGWNRPQRPEGRSGGCRTSAGPGHQCHLARPAPRWGRGDLPGDVDRPTRGHLDHVGVAGRVVQCLGIDEVGRDGLLPG